MMKKKEIADLRERWAREGPVDLRTALVAGGSPFGQTEHGLEDFRGVSIDQSLHRIAFSKVDLSYSEMDLGQFASEIEDCLFVGCRFESNLSKSFVRCSFEGSRLSGSVLRGTYESCSFERANLTSVRCSQAAFKECAFIQTGLRKASFFDCKLERCAFEDCKLGSGSFAGSRFLDCTFTGLDFARTVMERVSGVPAELLSKR